MFIVEFPYNIGTFVRVKKDNSIGTIACYNCVAANKDEDGNQFLVVVSGYKDAWSGEYLLEELELLSDIEINKLNNKSRVENDNIGVNKTKVYESLTKIIN